MKHLDRVTKEELYKALLYILPYAECEAETRHALVDCAEAADEAEDATLAVSFAQAIIERAA